MYRQVAQQTDHHVTGRWQQRSKKVLTGSVGDIREATWD